MKVIDAVAEILKREGVEFLACYPTTPIIEGIQRARRATEEGKPALLDFITSEEIAYSRGRPLN